MPRRLLGALLIGRMAVGAVALWIGIPLGWLCLVVLRARQSSPPIRAG